MSIRYRLAAMCAVIALLPAIPLSILVSKLLDKSFNVGLSETMEEALDSGMAVSRKHLEQIHLAFEGSTGIVASRFEGALPDSALMAVVLSEAAVLHGIDGFMIGKAAQRNARPGAASSLPGALAAYSAEPGFEDLVANAAIIERRAASVTRAGLTFYETEDRAVQFAVWYPSGSTGSLLFYKRTDPEFIARAESLLLGRQLFAQLRLSQSRLRRSFLYPFISIYAVILVLSLAFAFVMSERLAAPIRQLVAATSAVAGGDWRIQLKQKTGGEIGSLVNSFNRMVKRLDTQRRRLIDLEKIASWREIGRHLAHEIKNPLLPIRLTVQEMKDQYGGEDERYRDLLGESVRVVEDELNHLQRLVKEFSSFARMPGLSPVMGSMEQIVRDVARLYPQAHITIDVAPDLPETVFDPDQMRRVLTNLFDNSISVLPPGEEAKIDILIRSESDNLIVRFADSGPGIPHENLAKIFDPYFSTRTGGTGLGLAMVKNIILLHEGAIEASNVDKGGAAFVIMLPIAGPAAKPASEEDDRISRS